MRVVSCLALTALTVSTAVDAQQLRSLVSFDSLLESRDAAHDTTCVFKLSKLSCQPSDVCSFQFKLGDLTPSQSCRVKKTTAGGVPQQVHTAFAGTTPGTAMTISWTTFTKLSDPVVWIGTTPTSLELSDAVPSIVTYYSDDKYSLFNYHATVTGLTPHTVYSFQVGSQATAEDRSDVSTFTTARATTDDDEFDIAIYGDFGVGASSQPTVDYVNKNLPGKVDFVFHVGDISYADNAGVLTASEAVGFFYEETYNAFMNLISPVMSSVPYMVLVGNHEAECHSARCLLSSSKKDQLGNYQAYNARFKMPSAESGGAKNMWYSFDHGPVHFTAISSETDYTGAPKNSFTGRKYGGFGDQLAWLEADLQKADANRANTPWLMVMMHRAIYTRSQCDANGVPTGEALPVQKAFEDLFIKYNVDVVVSGHVHLYSRHFPIKKNVAVMDGVSEDKKTYTKPQAPVYVISGAAGSNEGHKAYDTKQNITWNAVMDNTNFGISKLHVSRTSLQWQFIAVATGAIIDDFEITK
jgi:acid phosphatase type 7